MLRLHLAAPVGHGGRLCTIYRNLADMVRTHLIFVMQDMQCSGECTVDVNSTLTHTATRTHTQTQHTHATSGPGVVPRWSRPSTVTCLARSGAQGEHRLLSRLNTRLRNEPPTRQDTTMTVTPLARMYVCCNAWCAGCTQQKPTV